MAVLEIENIETITRLGGMGVHEIRPMEAAKRGQ